MTYFTRFFSVLGESRRDDRVCKNAFSFRLIPSGIVHTARASPANRILPQLPIHRYAYAIQDPEPSLELNAEFRCLQVQCCRTLCKPLLNQPWTITLVWQDGGGSDPIQILPESKLISSEQVAFRHQRYHDRGSGTRRLHHDSKLARQAQPMGYLDEAPPLRNCVGQDCSIQEGE